MKQGLTILAFLGLAIAISYIPERFVKAVTFPTYVVILVMLIVVEMVGFVGKGAQRWLDLGFIRLQPSEFMKPAVVLVLARFYDLLPAGRVRRWRGLWPAALLVCVPWALILVQPDLGTATMVLVGGVTVMFLAGLPMWYFLSARGGAVAAALPIVFAMMHEYQRKRVLIFLDPEATRSAPAITSPSRRSRSARAASGARAISTAARATSIICPKAIPTSSSPPSSRNGAWSAA